MPYLVVNVYHSSDVGNNVRLPSDITSKHFNHLFINYLNISLSLSGSLALLDLLFSLFDLDGLLTGDTRLHLDDIGVVDLTREGVKGSGGIELELFRLVLEILREQVLRGTGTLRLEDRDVLLNKKRLSIIASFRFSTKRKNPAASFFLWNLLLGTKRK